jgi:cytochrome c553
MVGIIDDKVLYKDIVNFIAKHENWCMCEWCHKTDIKSSKGFYHVQLFGTNDHYICKDCYEHLKLLE